MKATLEYELPEEQELYLLAVKALDTQCEIDEIDNQLRSWWKHGGHDFKTPEDVMEWVREKLPRVEE